MTYSEDHLKRILGDVEYLIDEAEALIYVIDGVPVAEKAAGVESMMEMMALIDHAQISYYRPLIERIYSVPKVDERPADFRETFKQQNESSADSEDEKEQVQELLQSIAKNRRGLLTFVNKLPLTELRQQGNINGVTRSIADLLEEMVNFERQQLKQIAERILTLDSNMNSGRGQS